MILLFVVCTQCLKKPSKGSNAAPAGLQSWTVDKILSLYRAQQKAEATGATPIKDTRTKDFLPVVEAALSGGSADKIKSPSSPVTASA